MTRRSLLRLGWIQAAPPPAEKTENSDEIEFRALEPVSLKESQKSQGTEQCVCPVTRQILEWGTKIYQCRECKMSYSPEGWEFLRKTDGGRCCGCRQKKTVLPLR